MKRKAREEKVVLDQPTKKIECPICDNEVKYIRQAWENHWCLDEVPMIRYRIARVMEVALYDVQNILVEAIEDLKRLGANDETLAKFPKYLSKIKP